MTTKKEYIKDATTRYRTPTLNIRQTSTELNCSENHVRQLVKRGELIRIPNTYRAMFRLDTIADFLRYL